MARKRKLQERDQENRNHKKPSEQPDDQPQPSEGRDGEAEEEEDDGIGGVFAPNLLGSIGGIGGGEFASGNGDEASGQADKVANENFEREKVKLLLSNFNGEQMSRYEVFRRANINRTAVKKLSNAVLNQSITGNVSVALSGLSKVFVGEIVEKARDVQKRLNSMDGVNGPQPLRPEHVREAWRLFKLESGTVPQAQWRRQGGEGDGWMFR